ncbi:flavin reductase family protein [Thalassoglobus polymorphus]|uniref:Diflavin flavoprotein A 5 n=1 Tax=Thalassoglobus polymorphus TaxID=2527994 RepID=A0A517QHR5_9PLAN|nr:flavin reductase family protein [Thalassoglobus polymorphus]QDT31171.1 Putative diflavin flavoprotein A 5 [Thalassoglobus polymorphus]
MNQEQIGPVLGRIPSGVLILTARSSENDETGMLASWVQQASFEPPMVTVAVNTKRYLNDWLKDGVSVALSLVGETQKKLMGHFGKGFEPGEPAFEGLSTEETPTGLTVLSDAMGWLEGTVRSSLQSGDHTVYLVEITSGKPSEEIATEKPYVHIRKNGFGY